LRFSKAQSLISVPSILEEISTLPPDQGVQALASLQFVAFGGGLLKPRVGEKLTAGGVKVLNHYGSTESGPIAPFFVPRPDYDWHYFRLRKDMNMRLERGPLLEEDVQSYTLITHPFGWETTFAFQDQLIGNPRNPTSDFSAVGRNDDLIVLSNGEKVTPRILETMLSESHLVKAAIAFGDGQLELGVIIQPSLSPAVEGGYDRFKSSIWPIVLQAGERMDAHARISSQDAIIIVPSGTLLPRSDKGSIMRKEVYKMFEAEIAAVYQALDNKVVDTSAVHLDMDNLEEDLKTMIQTRLTWRVKAEEWTIDDDFFELGMDSLQAVQLRRFILSFIPNLPTSAQKAERLPRDIIYQNPTVTQLAKALKDPAELSPNDSSIDHLVEQFSIRADKADVARDAGAVVLMTGGTGSLGSCMLAHLASLPSIARVICLNRPSRITDAYIRQLEAFKSKCIIIDTEAWSKIEIFETDTALPLLGLKETEYTHILEQVTHVFHNAWPMDFKRKLPSFKAQFQVLQNLLGLARNAHSIRPLVRPKMLFASSIAVVGQYPRVKKETIVPEVFMEEERCSNDIGYAKAKLVCEKILERAASDHADKFEVVYVRVGQLSGSKKSGSWNTDEHIAALFRSSQAIGSLPRLEGVSSP
jgi:nucleoside-diphosphate-sugar epimerase